MTSNWTAEKIPDLTGTIAIARLSLDESDNDPTRFLPYSIAALRTIKAHIRNIHGKLDVHSRTQAATRSQKLGLLPRFRD